MGTKYRKLSFEELSDIARKYKTKRAFYDADPSAFVVASRNKKFVPADGQEKPKDFIGPVQGKIVSTLDEICTHMYAGKFGWTMLTMKNAAKKYKTRTEFSKGDRAAYSAASRRGVLDEVCAHMPKRKTRSDKKKKKANA